MCSSSQQWKLSLVIAQSHGEATTWLFSPRPILLVRNECSVLLCVNVHAIITLPNNIAFFYSRNPSLEASEK